MYICNAIFIIKRKKKNENLESNILSDLPSRSRNVFSTSCSRRWRRPCGTACARSAGSYKV